MKVLISKKTGLYYYYTGIGDYHCKEGVIKKIDIDSGEKIVKSNINREFLVFNANEYDITKKYKRGPQLINPKDLGYIIARSGISKHSLVIDAGSGSGAACSFFANFVKKVISYDIREDHTLIAKNNSKLHSLDNIEFKVGNLADDVEKLKDIDLLFLDMPNPVEILEKNLEGVKSGSYIICYVPSISQIQEITNSIASKDNLYLEEISEVILRHWRVWEKISRPEHRKEIDHTAFLVFIRKI